MTSDTPASPAQKHSRLPWILLALLCAGELATGFFLTWNRLLLPDLSPMGRSWMVDHYTLPRCGLALRMGTSMLHSSATYPTYGYHATDWSSHPMLCLVGGVPLSYLPPLASAALMFAVYGGILAFLLAAFGRQRIAAGAPFQLRDFLFFSSCSLSLPWFVGMTLGNYHLLLVLALGLVLLHESAFTRVGFLISACGKPVLAPAGFALVLTKRWRDVFWIVLIALAASLPWLLFRYDGIAHGLAPSLRTDFRMLLLKGSVYMEKTVLGWDQEMGWSKVFDEFFPQQHFLLRRILGCAVIAAGAWIAAKRDVRAGVAVISLWFFFVYARAHEYHYTSALPVLLFLWCGRGERYRKAWALIVTTLLMLPTTWYWLRHSPAYGIGKLGYSLDFARARAETPGIFWAFLLQRPVGVALLFLGIFWTELRTSAKGKEALPTPVSGNP